jgi:membrane fusion protein (multidrug efflux system)
MKHKKIILVSIGGGLLAFILAIFYFAHWRYIETTDNAYIQADITTISAKITGYVEKIYVEENQPISQGELLIALQPKEFKARVEEAEASITLAKANLMNVEARLDLQSSKIKQSKAEVEQAQAEFQHAKKDYERTFNLVRENIMSKKQLDQAKADYLKAAASLKSSLAAFEAAQQQVPVLKTEHQENEAKISQALAKKLIAESDLENTKISAPISGVIGNKIVQLGQLVRPGQQLLSIVPCEPYIYANFKETQVRRMRIGQRVTIKVDAYPGQTFKGHIHGLSPASGAVFSLLPPENATGNFTKIVQRIPVKILFDDSLTCYSMRPGMSVVVKVNTKQKPK